VNKPLLLITLFSEGDTLDDLANKGVDVSDIEDSVVYDPVKGMSWGTPYSWGTTLNKKFNIEIPEGYGAIRIVWSGGFAVPSGSLGKFLIMGSGDDAIFYSSDSHANNNNGQYLYINHQAIYSGSRIDIVNREDTVLTGTYRSVAFSMGYYNSYPFSRRYIKEIELIPMSVLATSMYNDSIISYWPLYEDTKDVVSGRNMVSHGSVTLTSDGCRIYTGGWLEINTPDISAGFTYFIDVEVYPDHVNNDYIHFFTEYNDQLNYTFKMTSPHNRYPMHPYVYRRDQQTVNHCLGADILLGDRKIYTVVFDNTTGESSIFIDGAQCSTGTIVGDVPWTKFRIGNWNGESLSGMVRGAALYRGRLEDSEIARIATALRSKGI